MKEEGDYVNIVAGQDRNAMAGCMQVILIP